MADQEQVPDDGRKKAQAFFTRGKSVADAGSYDYAIEMYVQGLMIDPDNVDAHRDLRNIAMKRKASSGKPMGMLDTMKFLRAGKDFKVNMLNAEKVASFDAGNLNAMEAMIVAASKAGYLDTVMWLGPLFERAIVDCGKKADPKKFVVLKDVYKDLKQWALALRSAQYALQLKPNDLELQEEAKNLSVLETMHKGNYDGKGGFTGSLRNKDDQSKSLEEERDVKSENYLERGVQEAEAAYKADANEPGKMLKLVEALVKTEQGGHENRAIALLQEWYDKTKQFRFRRNIGQINMKIWNRMFRARTDDLKAQPTNEALKKEVEQLRIDKLEFELSEYREWADNYPTEISLKFDVAKRLYYLKRYDEAIPVLQTVASDPKLKTEACALLGKSFFAAGFPDEAAQVLETAINEYPLRNDEKSKDLFYWRARSLEQIGDMDGALKLYSQIAQWQFNYEDAQVRIKRLREDQKERQQGT